jgi:hypothetical protein
MNPLKHVFLFLTTAAGVCFAAFTLPWSTLDGGGGKSTGTSVGGTVYTLTGTIGQFDATAAPTTGDGLSMNGGFWAAIVEPLFPDHPSLTITRLGNGDANLQWQSDAAGWQIETSTNLVQWFDLGGPITTAGSLTVTPVPSVPKQFFRLRNP